MKPEPPNEPRDKFRPYVSPEQSPPEFTLKAIVFGSIFGILFGASTVYLALKAGLAVSVSIPIAVLSISALRLFGRATILENNIVQTIGSAGESVAAGVAFTIPALLFLSDGADGERYFDYATILTLAASGGVLGVLFMVPLRRSLIVQEHGTLPYPEGTACADVLIAGERGGRMARLVFGGVILSAVYKLSSAVFGLWKESVHYVTSRAAALPNATIANEVSPEYLGVGYILGPRVGGVMVAGGIVTYLVLIPLLTMLVPMETVVADLTRLGKSPEAIDKLSDVRRYHEAYTRYIGAGAVTMAGLITLVKTLPTIARSVGEAFGALRRRREAKTDLRTERDLPITWVIGGALALGVILAVLPILPGGLGGRALVALLVLAFGFLFVTVSSRIVGLIGASSNPVSGMTIATLLGTSLVFLSVGMGGDASQPVALCVGAIVCIAAANAGATSQDLKTGYLVGATPIRQQFGLMIGVLVSVAVIGLTLKYLHASFTIGSERFPAPQANLMATVIQGVMGQNLPWGYLWVGAMLALMVHLCGVSPLAWAVGAYLPIATTLPIFLGGMLRGGVDRWAKRRGGTSDTHDEVAPGMLFATGLVAGATLTGVASSVLKGIETTHAGKPSDVLSDCLRWGAGVQASLPIAPDLLALLPYAGMAAVLVGVALRRAPREPAG